jgi:hypothetical protein
MAGAGSPATPASGAAPPGGATQALCGYPRRTGYPASERLPGRRWIILAGVFSTVAEAIARRLSDVCIDADHAEENPVRGEAGLGLCL